jgi:hypothetical protein
MTPRGARPTGVPLEADGVRPAARGQGAAGSAPKAGVAGTSGSVTTARVRRRTAAAALSVAAVASAAMLAALVRSAPAPADDPRRTGEADDAVGDSTVSRTEAASHDTRARADRASAMARCGNRWFPMRPGATRVYRVVAAGAPGTLTLTLVAIHAAAGPASDGASGGAAGTGAGGGVTARWTAHTSLVVPGQDEPMVWTVPYERHCTGDLAEEPWTGWGLPMAGISLGPQTWRMPDALAPGVRYEGTVSMRLDDRAAETWRTHEVSGIEPVEVAAGRFRALRVERADVGHLTLRSTLWLAEGPGLVRAEEALGGGERLVLELLSWSDGDEGRAEGSGA